MIAMSSALLETGILSEYSGCAVVILSSAVFMPDFKDWHSIDRTNIVTQFTISACFSIFSLLQRIEILINFFAMIDLFLSHQAVSAKYNFLVKLQCGDCTHWKEIKQSKWIVTVLFPTSWKLTYCKRLSDYCHENICQKSMYEQPCDEITSPE